MTFVCFFSIIKAQRSWYIRKKIIGILLIVILIVLVILGFKKNPVETPPVEENPPVKNEVVNPPEEDEKKPEIDAPKKENEKEDKGMFLGMDDSNFVVIFSSEEKKDVHYKIASSLNFKDSDIELGAAVTYRYTVSETDEKTITFIEAVKQ